MTSADALLFATATVGAAAASLTAFGQRRRLYAGWRWWVVALWLTTLGLLLAATLPPGLGALLATPLLLQWPLVTLIGLRRFHARQQWPGGERADWLLLVLAVAFVGVDLQLVDGGSPWAVNACVMGVHLYAALTLFLAPSDADATPMLGLGAVIALAAFAPGLAVLPSIDPLTSLQTHAMAAALGAIVLAFVAVTLVCDRTERQLRDSRRRLRVLANLDALTQAPNRRHFHELAVQALRHDPPGSAVLLLFDVDHFKQINDQLGHAAGDRALCMVSSSVQAHLRALDVAGRHGGDEFVLLLRCADTDVGMRVAGRIVAEVQSRAAASELPPISLSFGLVQVGVHEMLDAALRRADQALYEAKRQGRSRAVAAVGDETRPVFSESQRLGLTPC